MKISSYKFWFFQPKLITRSSLDLTQFRKHSLKNGEGPDEKGFLSDFLNRFGEADDIFIFPAYAKNRNETFNTVIFSNQSNLDSQTSLVEVIYDQGQACCPPAE